MPQAPHTRAHNRAHIASKQPSGGIITTFLKVRAQCCQAWNQPQLRGEGACQVVVMKLPAEHITKTHNPASVLRYAQRAMLAPYQEPIRRSQHATAEHTAM